MKPLLRRLWPSSIGGQIALIMLAAVLISQAIPFGLFLLSSAQFDRDMQATRQVHTLTSTLQSLAAADPADRPRLIDAANKANDEFQLALSDVPGEEGLIGTGPSFGAIDRALGPSYVLRAAGPPPPPPGAMEPREPQDDHPPGPPPKEMRFIVELPDGTPILVTTRFAPPRPSPWMGVVSAVIFAALAIIPLLVWATLVLTRRLRSFAEAAADFTPDGDHAPVPETGPAELRTVAVAFNRMRERIAGLVQNRTMMLTAVGHDLRTPVTRLRLRTEFIKEPEIRDAMLRDLDHMSAMIDDVLSLLRDPRASATTETVDLSALLQTLSDDFADLGADMAFDGAGHALVRGRTDDLVRAFTNLIENAQRHAKTIRLSLVTSTDSVTVYVDDDGPGIPAAERATLLQPFARGDAARAANAEGDDDRFGLGLPIVQAIVTRHGGAFSLADSPLGGLRAAIVLPLANA